MKRSRSGGTVHKDDCIRAKNAVHWAWADHCADEMHMFVEMSAYPWLKLCQACFTGTPTDNAVRLMQAQL